MASGKKVHIRIRMYRHGLGDCFLLTFQHGFGSSGGGDAGSVDEGEDDPGDNNKPFHMLIDCGLIGTHRTKEEKAEDLRLIREVAANVRDTTGKHLNLVVATHRHWDHVSGFLQAQEIFQEITIDQVWVPWTEDDSDERATNMWKRSAQAVTAIFAAYQLSRVKLGVTQQFSGAGPDGETAGGSVPVEERVEQESPLWSSILSLAGFEGSLTPEEGLSLTDVKQDKYKAMRSIIERVPLDKTQYFDAAPEGNTLPPITLDGCEGVRFYVLGPTREIEYLSHMNPRKRDPDDDIYMLSSLFLAADLEAAATTLYRRLKDKEEHNRIILGAASTQTVGVQAAGQEPPDRYAPFDDKDNRYSVSEADAKNSSDFARYYANGRGWRGIDEDWLQLAGSLALMLDDVTNNTSLALAIELVESRKVLLFVGDAQVGNWKSWGNRKWKVLEANGETRRPRIKNLLKKTVLYKVGHHGSHNATLSKNGLEQMVHPDLVAVIPVNHDTAVGQSTSTNPDGWEMPAETLQKKLIKKAKGRVLRADTGLPLDEELTELTESELLSFQKFKQKMEPQLTELPEKPLWFDLEIEG